MGGKSYIELQYTNKKLEITVEDIRYPQKNQTWKEHLEEKNKATGTRIVMSKL